MIKSEYQKMFIEEQSHWFFKTKRMFIESFLNKVLIPPNIEILEPGCGTGANRIFLEKYGSVTSLDFSQDALDFCQKREIKRLIRGDLNQLGLKSETFDFAFLLDVLYHQWVKDDISALKDILRILKPGGKLLITDSAFPFLLSSHDKAVMTRERYTIPSITKKLEQAGFKVLRTSYMFATTFPLLTLVRLIQKIAPIKENSSNVFKVPQLINQLVLKIMSLEARILSRSRLPFGSSVIVLAEK
jgi:ubiquinone/menaquinone biosynthesis C-methylase UbiE